GTPGYMAPEQAAGKKVDHRADIYALGMTLFEMLAGAPAFVADDPIALVVMNMREPLPDLRARGLGLPEALVQLVEMMAAKEPDARVQSCDAVVAAIDGLLRGAGDGTLDRETDRVIPPTNVHAERPAALSVAMGGAAVARPRSPWLVGGVVALAVI